MRKISTFSSKLGYAPTRTVINPTENNRPTRTIDTFSQTKKDIDGDLIETSRERREFMSSSIMGMLLVEMRRPVNIRFIRLMKSAKNQLNKIKSAEDLKAIKTLLIKELSFILTEYADILAANPSLTINNYLKISSVFPQLKNEARLLSLTMIRANKIKEAQGFLPAKNQKDLDKALNGFIQGVISQVATNINPNTLVRINEAT